MNAPRITTLARSRAGEAANVLARAFFDDPLTLFTLPDAAHRALALPRLMRVAVTNALDGGHIDATRGRVRGVAIWLSPEPPGAAEAVERGEQTRARLARALGPQGWERMNLARNALGERFDADISEPVWHLTLLGVDPVRQGEGVGAALLAPILARADSAGVACYLETFKGENLAFYHKHGFDVLAEGNVPSGGPRYWTMVRRAPV